MLLLVWRNNGGNDLVVEIFNIGVVVFFAHGVDLRAQKLPVLAKFLD